MFNRILVAIDGSKMSDKALETGLQFAKERFSKVAVVYVEKQMTVSQGMTEDSVNELYESMKSRGEEILRKAETLADEYEIEIQTLYLVGDPATQIIKAAEDGNYQLIMVGSRGLGGIKELMLGSVSHKVSQLSKCPVLIVK